VPTKKKKQMRAQRKAAEQAQRDRESALIAFLGSYDSDEQPQDPGAASVDSQIKSLSLSLAECISSTPQGAVVDVGAGRGVMLERLASFPAFLSNSDWFYVAVEFPSHHSDILDIARGHRLHRRVEVIDVEEFYKKWILDLDVPKPTVVVVRNVLHELSIDMTAQLLSRLSCDLSSGEHLLIQDLATFPVAERGNVCWREDDLNRVLRECGFETVVVGDVTRRGNRWFTVKATRDSRSVSSTTIRDTVIQGRLRHWRDWTQLGPLQPQSDRYRDLLLQKIDFDLQYAALTLRLIEAGVTGVTPLEASQEKIAAREAFQRAIKSGVVLSQPDVLVPIEDVPHFKDRANSQSCLHEFLSGRGSIAVIVGPPYGGKTFLVKHVLASFAHNRLPIHIDILATTGVWNIIEALLAEHDFSMPWQIIKCLKDTRFAAIEDIVYEALGRLLPSSVIVLDHFERLLQPDGLVADIEIREFITSVASLPEAKLIITSRSDVREIFPKGARTPFDHPPVGRFPRGKHVENLLAGIVGATRFPAELVEAIDRHPYLAYLAGQLIQRHGASAVSDPGVLDEFRKKLRKQVLRRILTEQARAAVEMASLLRVAVPRTMIIALCGVDSYEESLRLGLIYSETLPHRGELSACIGALRIRRSDDTYGEGQDTLPNSEVATHRRIAGQYEVLYREDDDPRWLRELWYHRLSSEPESLSILGVTYRSEIFAAAEFWYARQKKFEQALWAYQVVRDYGDSTVSVQMRIASCQIRTGVRQLGEDAFAAIYQQYPDYFAAKSSHVDSLLYINEFSDALALLEEHAHWTVGGWTSGQFGRANLGLQHNAEAVRSFRRQLVTQQEPVIYQSLARAYKGLGDRKQELEALETGLRKYPESRRLIIAKAAWYERAGKPLESLSLLAPRVRDKESDAWLLLPYIKSLCGCGKVAEARTLWNQNRGCTEPEHIRPTIEVELLRAEQRFEEALRVLEGGGIRNEHRTGQQLEVIFSWSRSTNDCTEQRRIAKLGLSLELDSASLRNVPVLISLSKLAIQANDRSKFCELATQVRTLSPHSVDLVRLILEAPDDWSLDSNAMSQ